MISCMLVQAYLNLERFNEAENDANVILELDPANTMALLRRGWARLSLEIPDVDGGRADLSRVLSIEPGSKKVSLPWNAIVGLRDAHSPTIVCLYRLLL